MTAPALRALVEGLNEAVWLVGADDGRVCAINAAALDLLGIARDAAVGAPAANLLATPEDQAFWADPGAAGELASHTLLVRADGDVRHVRRRITRMAGGAPDAPYMVALQDLTAQRRAEDAREALLDDLRATLESTGDGILVTDLAGRVRSFNRRFAQLWSVPEALLRAGDAAALHDWLAERVADPRAYRRRLAAIQDAPLLHASDRLLLRSGQVIERSTQPQCSRGRPTGRVYAFRDLSEQVAANHRIEALASTDTLTGLPNRRRLAERMAHELAIARRNGSAFALLMLDLDRFKRVNDSLGSAEGDRVLREVAERVKGCLREVDMVARVGGDQFAVLLHGADARGAEMIARRALDAIAQPFALDASPFTITVSIGVALYPVDGASDDELVCHAENALRRAKEGGRSGYRFHYPAKAADQRSRMRLDHAMRQALASGGFRLHYQPQICLASGAVVGAEALIRWRDPVRGDIAPGEFIPVAEDSGFIVPIGDWVLGEAVRQAAQWRDRGHPLPISINVSALQFRQADFVARVRAALAGAALPAGWLELELTESILVRDADEALHRLRELAALGVRLAIDDFGTGYSSLAYLKRFPIGKLKIDRSFVQGLPRDDSDAGIVRAILQMAQALGMRATAEGVENEAQRRFLIDAGCREFQGFLCAPALDAQTFEARMLRAHAPAGA